MKDDIVKLFQSSRGFISNNNYHIIEIKDGYCKLEGIITECSLNPYGVVHGGYIFGLADTAAGIAISSIGKKAVTINSSILYFKQGCGNKLVAVANCLKSGNNLASAEVEIFNDYDELISKVLCEFYFLER